MYENLTCIGGPLDGRIKSTDDEMFHIHSTSPSVKPVHHAWTPASVAIDVHIYELAALDFGTHKFLFFKESSLSYAECVEKLLKGYRNKS